MHYKRTFLSLFLGITLLLALALGAAAQTGAPSVSVSDQAVQDGMVMIDEVVAAQDGWLVIHAQKDGGIGPVIGYAAVTAGSNTYLTVEIDPMGATETMYAMLHIDEGTKGTYEFPGADGPAKVDGKPVTPPFMVTNYADMMAMHPMEMMTPSVTVTDQDVADGMVTIGEVAAAQDGWLVIHAQKDGGIGPVIGHTAVTAGANADVRVEIDPMGATETLYAMLHIDEGVVGTYEFPGPDGPAKVDGKPVTPPFMVTNYADMSASMQQAAAPEMLPVTGGVIAEKSPVSTSWGLPVVLFLAALLVVGVYTRRSRKSNG